MKEFLKRNGAWIGFLVLALIVVALTEGAFLSERNLTNLLRQTAINGVLAAGMTLVILTGGIDLSIGSIVALAGILVGMSQVHWGWGELGFLGAAGSFLLAALIGSACGLVNGVLIAGIGIPPFVITLGMMVIARGLAMILSDGSGIAPVGEALYSLGGAYFSGAVTWGLIGVFLVAFAWRYLRRLSEGIFPLLTFGLIAYSFVTYKGFPIPVVFLLVAMGITSALLTHTTLGRCIYAIGSNEQAALWAGVPIKRVKTFVYLAMGALSGVGGLLLTARLNGAVPTAGQLFELDAIAAVVIGGTSLRGGVGTIMGSFVGALTIATLNNGMDLLQVPSFYQMVFKGIIIIVAVGLDRGQRQTT